MVEQKYSSTKVSFRKVAWSYASKDFPILRLTSHFEFDEANANDLHIVCWWYIFAIIAEMSYACERFGW